MTATIHHGDCLDVLRAMPDNSVEAVVCDPPYGLSNTSPDKITDTIVRWATGDREAAQHHAVAGEARDPRPVAPCLTRSPAVGPPSRPRSSKGSTPSASKPTNPTSRSLNSELSGQPPHKQRARPHPDQRGQHTSPKE